jgi:hypothetical protein
MSFLFFIIVAETLISEKMPTFEIISMINVIFALLLAFLAWIYQLGFFNAKVNRIEKDINELHVIKR